ncbi:unnamed protein product [Arctogadus glacialis]
MHSFRDLTRRGWGSTSASSCPRPSMWQPVARKPRPPDLEPQQCRQLGLVEDCGWTGQRATHPHPSRRRGRRRARRRRATEDGVPELHSSAPLRRKLVGATMEVIPDHTPRTSRDCWRRASQPGRKAAPQRGRR